MTPREAESIAHAVLCKARKSSNSYALFYIDGKFHSSRDNSTLYERWKKTGTPELIGLYNKLCHMPMIAEDILYRARG